MAFRFDGAGDNVKFAIGTIDDASYNNGNAYTALAAVKRGATGAWHSILGVDTAAVAVRRNELEFNPSNQLSLWSGILSANAYHSTLTETSTAAWRIVGVSWGGRTTGVPTFHRFDGATWTHQAGVQDFGDNAAGVAFASTDVIVVGETIGNDDLNADVCCVGYRKASLSNSEVEAATLTSFGSWEGIGFDWLVGFRDSGTQTDRTGGGGNETSRAGTSLVDDPPGWAWSAPRSDYTRFPKAILRSAA